MQPKIFWLQQNWILFIDNYAQSFTSDWRVLPGYAKIPYLPETSTTTSTSQRPSTTTTPIAPSTSSTSQPPSSINQPSTNQSSASILQPSTNESSSLILQPSTSPLPTSVNVTASTSEPSTLLPRVRAELVSPEYPVDFSGTCFTVQYLQHEHIRELLLLPVILKIIARRKRSQFWRLDSTLVCSIFDHLIRRWRDAQSPWRSRHRQPQRMHVLALPT